MWIEGPQQPLYLLPVLLFPFGVLIVMWLAMDGGLMFPVLLAVLAVALVAGVIGMARWFVELSTTEVRYRNRWRTEVVPLAEVVRFELVSVQFIPLISDIKVVPRSRYFACVAMRLRTGDLVPLVAARAEWVTGTRIPRSYCERLQGALQAIRYP